MSEEDIAQMERVNEVIDEAKAKLVEYPWMGLLLEVSRRNLRRALSGGQITPFGVMLPSLPWAEQFNEIFGDDLEKGFPVLLVSWKASGQNVHQYEERMRAFFAQTVDDLSHCSPEELEHRKHAVLAAIVFMLGLEHPEMADVLKLM
jgi:hypothetical protein